MATKKTASAKKSTVKKTTSPKTTKVTTVKAVSASVEKPADKLFGLNMYRMPLLGAAIAEFIGTFLLATAVLTSQGQPLYILFALMGIVLVTGVLSGGYANPALTIGSWATRKISGLRAIIYIVAQVLGAMLAYVVINAYVNGAPAVSADAAAYGATAPEIFKVAALPDGKEWGVFFAELLGTTIFGFFVASALKAKDRMVGALTAGSGLFLGLLITGVVTSYIGSSSLTVLNPAIAVALQAIDFGTFFKSIWPFAIYVFASALGAIIGFILNDLLNVESDGGADVL